MTALLALALAVFSAARTDGSGVHQTAARPSAAAAPAGKTLDVHRLPRVFAITADEFRSVPFLTTAIRLQSAGPREAIAELSAAADAADDDNDSEKLMILCRILFRARRGKEFRPPSIGRFGFIGDSRPSDWPLAPITVVAGVPFLIAPSYSIGGTPEDAAMYLDYCTKSCEWNPRRLRPRDARQLQRALHLLWRSQRWRHPLNARERTFLAEQIEP